MNSCRRAVCVDGQQHRTLAAIDVGNVHAAVGTYQPVQRFGDENVLLRTTRLASRKASSTTRASMPFLWAKLLAAADGFTESRATVRPSALDTILCLTTRISPS